MQLATLRIAASLLLLAHASFGCAWCHAAHHVGPEDTENCCDSHDATACHPVDNDPAKPCPVHLTCQVRCIYLPTASVQLDHPLPFHGFVDGLLIDPAATEGCSAAHVALCRSDGRPEPGALPRHLVFQLLLI